MRLEIRDEIAPGLGDILIDYPQTKGKSLYRIAGYNMSGEIKRLIRRGRHRHGAPAFR